MKIACTLIVAAVAQQTDANPHLRRTLKVSDVNEGGSLDGLREDYADTGASMPMASSGITSMSMNQAYQYLHAPSSTARKSAKSGKSAKSSKSGKAAKSSSSLTILHMNDHHSHLEEGDADVAAPEGLPGNVTSEDIEIFVGGFPRIVSAINSMEDEAVEYGNDVLKLHAGDAITGTTYYTVFEGAEPDAIMMNQVCFDAFALGNHEFDDGDHNLAMFIQNILIGDNCPDTPILSANLVPAPDSPLGDLITNYAVKTLASGEEVGIIGITVAGKTMELSRPDEGTILLDEKETAMKYVKELEAMGINKIIILSHIGYDRDLEDMATIPGVDVVIGGDSHSLLGEAESKPFGTPSGEYPTTVHTETGTVCVVQAWEYANGVGKLDVIFDKEGKVTSCMGKTVIPFDPSKFEPALEEEAAAFLTAYIESTFEDLVAFPEDAGAMEALSDYKSQIDELKMAVIAAVPEVICFERIPGQGRSNICPVEATATQGGGVCNLVSKAFLERTLTADIAINNAGGCRTDIAAGNFTINAAISLLPFSNTLVTMDMTGDEVVQVLNDAAGYAFNPDGGTGAYPYANGIRYDVNSSAEPGSYITNVEVNPQMAGEWMPIEPEMVYSVVTNSYIAAGRDGYVTFATVDGEDTFTEYAQAFIDYAKEVETLVDLPLDEYSTKVFQ